MVHSNESELLIRRAIENEFTIDLSGSIDCGEDVEQKLVCDENDLGNKLSKDVMWSNGSWRLKDNCKCEYLTESSLIFKHLLTLKILDHHWQKELTVIISPKTKLTNEDFFNHFNSHYDSIIIRQGMNSYYACVGQFLNLYY